jgi:DNA-binding IclR family transcriptional regulator
MSASPSPSNSSSNEGEADGGGVAARRTSLEKGLNIVAELAASGGGMTMHELARATGLNRTTTYRISDVLERMGWIQPVSVEPGRVDVGPRLLGLSVLIASKYDTEARLQPIIDRTAASLSETVHVGMLEGSYVVHVARALPDIRLNMAARIGAKELAHVTSLGKALLATLSKDKLLDLYPEEVLSGKTPHSIRRRTELLAHLEACAERGYASDDQESGLGVRCVGAPVFDAAGQGLFAISVTTVPARMEGEDFQRVVHAVCATAALATASFGGRVPPPWPGTLDPALQSFPDRPGSGV